MPPRTAPADDESERDVPYYDKRRGDLVIRVVYDGAPEAGKTTNVRQLAELVSLQRRGAVVSPDSTGRRTEFFDWMDFEGGFVEGSRLRCQLLTVPGQTSLLRRRKYLLETADVVVFVADSHPLLVEESREQYESLREALARASDAEIATVLQANKQDRANAVPPAELAQRMGVARDVPVIGARAHVGAGVKETFFLAVRLAVERVRALAARGAIAAESDTPDSPAALHEIMLARESEPPVEACAMPAAAPGPSSALLLPEPAQIPGGCVWPAGSRARCAAAHVTHPSSAVSSRAWAPADACEVRGGAGLVLHTRAAWRWPSLDAARTALSAEVRASSPLQPAMPEERAFVVAPENDAWRLWVISPDLATLGDELEDALCGPTAPDLPTIAERWIDAWRALHAKLGDVAAALVPADVAWARSGWVVLGFGERSLRSAERAHPWSTPRTTPLLRELAAAGAWPALGAGD